MTQLDLSGQIMQKIAEQASLISFICDYSKQAVPMYPNLMENVRNSQVAENTT